MDENKTVNQETQNAGTETPKTFTQDEVNAIVAERLSRDRAKFADYETLKEKAGKFDEMQEANKTELQKATEKAAALEKELADMKQAAEVQAMRQKISTETGVPANLLTATTEDECKAQAEAIKAFAAPNTNYPQVKDGGEVGKSLNNTTRNQFAEWFNNQTQ